MASLSKPAYPGDPGEAITRSTVKKLKSLKRLRAIRMLSGILVLFFLAGCKATATPVTSDSVRCSGSPASKPAGWVCSGKR